MVMCHLAAFDCSSFWISSFSGSTAHTTVWLHSGYHCPLLVSTLSLLHCLYGEKAKGWADPADQSWAVQSPDQHTDGNQGVSACAILSPVYCHGSNENLLFFKHQIHRQIICETRQGLLFRQLDSCSIFSVLKASFYAPTGTLLGLQSTLPIAVYANDAQRPQTSQSRMLLPPIPS